MPALEEQRLLQRRMDWSRASGRAWLIVAGVVFSVIALVTTLRRFEDTGVRIGKFAFLAFFTFFFAWILINWLLWPFRLKCRIIPYFARELEPYGGKSSAAFKRGRALYQEIVALDRLAHSAGVRPLSEFGFADDYYDQEVRWHPATEGLRTTEVLASGAQRSPDLTADLEALLGVLRIAVEQGVEFSLVLRLDDENLQSVMLWEARTGRFW